MAKAKKAKKGARKAPKADPAVTGEGDQTVGGRRKSSDVAIPDEVIIRRGARSPRSQITESAEVRGDKSLQVIDIINSRPCEVHVIDCNPLSPAGDERLVHVEGAVGFVEICSASRAKSKFAVDPEGTVLYNGRGFDEVNPEAKYDLVDIVKLVELRGKNA